MPRPFKELKGFARVTLEPGESRQARILLSEGAFKYYDPDQKRWLLEPGDFEVLVGASAADIRLRGTFHVGS